MWRLRFQIVEKQIEFNGNEWNNTAIIGLTLNKSHEQTQTFVSLFAICIHVMHGLNNNKARS